ncbi:MAG TPA: DUF6498-containing protein [Thermoanaerobaculia bacterium]|nr:DUF6498-containing protein [Thermoanaerobaculia bacterium]HUM28958.1 DUF6498-containing protein [Thermoanaerobaculia bacterium]HXK67110.1 DUF6498-containing protein [Thermoanaerobaculia bacterium]
MKTESGSNGEEESEVYHPEKEEELPLEELKVLGTPSIPRSVFETIIVLATNAIPMVGVIQLHWSPFALLLLFILEGVVVLCIDAIKWVIPKSTLWIGKQMEKSAGQLFFFECLFIGFFGIFALLLYSPSREDPDNFIATFLNIREILTTTLAWPILGIALFRLQRLIQDLVSAGLFTRQRIRPLYFSGGGWMFLLFFLVMLGPFIADQSPNTMGGLIAIVILKTLGECLGIWLTFWGLRTDPRLRKIKRG